MGLAGACSCTSMPLVPIGPVCAPALPGVRCATIGQSPTSSFARGLQTPMTDPPDHSCATAAKQYVICTREAFSDSNKRWQRCRSGAAELTAAKQRVICTREAFSDSNKGWQRCGCGCHCNRNSRA